MLRRCYFWMGTLLLVDGMISEKNLREMEARKNAALTGPWKFSSSLDQRRGHISSESAHADICYYTPDEPQLHRGWKVANFTFIAHARADIPRLIAEVRELRAAVRDLADTLKLLKVQAIINGRAGQADVTRMINALISKHADLIKEIE